MHSLQRSTIPPMSSLTPHEFRRVAVIGAGTMGSGIAAHLANLGFQVTLLDRTADAAREAYQRAVAVKPPHFYLPATADALTVGALDDHWQAVREADWICEAIIEKLDAKRDLYERLDGEIRGDAFISTNTSGLEISMLAENRSDSFRSRFIGTHFFNPPRYLKLLELIPTPETDPRVVAELTKRLSLDAGRRVVPAKDTPGFIANRYGMWSMYKAVHVAEKLGLTIEQVDEITGPFLGRPRSGSFRLNDIVGLDIMADIASNLVERCPHDAQTKVFETPSSMAFLIDKGWIGAKAGQGWYQKHGRELLSLDLVTHAYRSRLEPDLPTVKQFGRRPLAERLRAGLKAKDEAGEFLREYLLPALAYADSLKEEISHTIQDFDRVMKWGFAWEAGPFEMADMISDIPEKAFYEGASFRSFSGVLTPAPYESEFAVLTDFPVIASGGTFRFRDLGDGVYGLSLTTKMGTWSPAAVREVSDFLQAEKPERIVLAGEGRSFSAGYDLKTFSGLIEAKDWSSIEQAIKEFQELGLLLGTIPSVAAVHGHCLGGGFEMAASCSLIAAHPESQIGLPEALVGLIPGGTGTVLMRQRGATSAKHLAETILLLAQGTVSTCADHARSLGYLRREDVTVYHPDRLLTQAKALALSVEARNDSSWTSVGGPTSGIVDSALQNLKKQGAISDHDINITSRLKDSMMRSTFFEEAVIKERQAFVTLCQEGLTLARINHMLESGRPLRN